MAVIRTLYMANTAQVVLHNIPAAATERDVFDCLTPLCARAPEAIAFVNALPGSERRSAFVDFFSVADARAVHAATAEDAAAPLVMLPLTMATLTARAVKEAREPEAVAMRKQSKAMVLQPSCPQQQNE